MSVLYIILVGWFFVLTLALVRFSEKLRGSGS